MKLGSTAEADLRLDRELLRGPAKPSRRWPEFLLVAAVFLLCFFASRQPLFALGWDGTDANGSDTDIFVHQPAKPNYFLMARFNGHDLYLPALGHPAPMYSMISQLGRLTGAFLDYETMSDAAIVRLLKLLVSACQGVIWCLLLAVVGFSRNLKGQPGYRALAYVGITALALSPMALDGSNEFQLDSFFGFIMVSAYALALFLWEKNSTHPRLGRGLVFCAAAFLSLGKNEWTLVLAVAALCVAALATICWYFENKIWSRQAWDCTAWTLAGLTVGNLGSWAFEPAHYVSGWTLLHGMICGASVVKPACLEHFGQLTWARLPYIQVHGVMLLYLAARLLIGKPLPSPRCLLAGVFGTGLFLAFFFSTWGNFPRYFAPAFIGLAVVSVWVCVDWPHKLPRVACMLALGLFGWFFYTGHVYAHSPTHASVCIHGQHAQLPAAGPEGLRLILIDDVYRRKDVDFIHLQLGVDGARKLRKQYGPQQPSP
jgi:hypothetical protein